jgi:hypothetical protein
MIPFRTISQEIIARVRPVHLDTYKLCKVLEEHEYTRPQASCIVGILRDAIHQTLEDAYKGRLTRLQHEKDNYLYRVLFSTLKSELQVIEKNEVSLIRMQHERIGREIERTHHKLLEDVALLKSNVTMEMNTHREAIRDLMTWTLQRKMYDVNNHLNIELSKIRIQMESIRLIVAGYLAAIVFAGGSLFVFYKYYRTKHPVSEQIFGPSGDHLDDSRDTSS